MKEIEFLQQNKILVLTNVNFAANVRSFCHKKLVLTANLSEIHVLRLSSRI